MFNVSRPTVERWRDHNGRRKQNIIGVPRRMLVGKKLIPEIARIMAANVGNTDNRHLSAARIYDLLKAPTSPGRDLSSPGRDLSSPVRDLSFSQRTVERMDAEVRPSFSRYEHYDEDEE